MLLYRNLLGHHAASSSTPTTPVAETGFLRYGNCWGGIDLSLNLLPFFGVSSP